MTTWYDSDSPSDGAAKREAAPPPHLGDRGETARTTKRMTINRLPLYQQAYHALRDRIGNGELAPGAHVDVQKFADELDISRTPVREAIRQLLQEGLLEGSRDGRARVFSPSVEDLAEIYITRAALESTSIEVAIKEGGDLELGRLENAVKRGRQGVEEDHWQLIVDANTDIHDWLLDASQSSYIRRFTAPMRVYVMRYRSLSMQFAHRRVIAQDAHEELLELVRRRDESARDYIYRHVILAGAWAIQNLKPDPSGDTPSVAYLRTAWLEHNAAEQ